MAKILLIDMCDPDLKILKEEFLRPYKDILDNENQDYDVILCVDIKKCNLELYDKVILTGTALKDFKYINFQEDMNNFFANYKKDFLAVCAGAQSYFSFLGIELIKNERIGAFKVNINVKDILFQSEDLNLQYFLHSLSIENLCPYLKCIATLDDGSCVAFKSNSKNANQYCFMFHPEVRAQEIIRKFLKT